VSQRGSVSVYLWWDCEAGAQDLDAVVSFYIYNAKRRGDFLSRVQRVSPKRVDTFYNEVFIAETLSPQQTPQLEARLNKIALGWIDILKRA